MNYDLGIMKIFITKFIKSSRLRLMLGIGLLTFNVGCSVNKYSSEQIQLDVDAAIAESQTTGYEEWLTSEFNPSRIFAKLKKQNDPQLQKALCDKLMSLDKKSLLVFKEVIYESGNDAQLGDCRIAIKTKYNDIAIELNRQFQDLGYARFQLESLNKSKPIIDWGTSGAPQFETELQFRNFDPEKGYLAITGDVEEKQVVLTFDDGPSPEYTPMILQALKETNVKAMFFQCGNRVEYQAFDQKNRLIEIGKNLARSVRDAGHVIGNHSYNHPNMGDINKCTSDSCRSKTVTVEQAKAQILRTKNILESALEMVVPFFRFPFGAHQPALDQFLIQQKMSSIFWNMDSLDWRSGSTEMDVLNRALVTLEKNQRGIILFHDIHEQTAKAIPQFLVELKARGFTPVVLQMTDSN